MCSGGVGIAHRRVQQARWTVTNLIGRFRNSLQMLNAVSVRSAALPVPASLETIARNRQTNDLPALTDTYYRTFGPVPAATDADQLTRDLMDVDDALALGTLKTLKASDQSGDLILQSGNRVEDEARQARAGFGAIPYRGEHSRQHSEPGDDAEDARRHDPSGSGSGRP